MRESVVVKSKVTIKREISNKIEQQLSNINLSKQAIKKAKKYTIFN